MTTNNTALEQFSRNVNEFNREFERNAQEFERNMQNFGRDMEKFGNELSKVVLPVGIATLATLGLCALPANPVIGGALFGGALAGAWAYNEQQKEDMRKVAHEEWAMWMRR